MTSPLAKQVIAANQRAKDMGVVGRLSALDWRRTIEAFGGHCAYCGGPPPLTINHFIPLAAFGGTTTQSNCVPSCLPCNRLKGDQYPDDQTLAFVAPERLARVRAYLQEIGRWRQESLQRSRERVPKLARDHHALSVLKQYCEARASTSADPHAESFALLCQRIFGIPWDPVLPKEVLESLSWHRVHASDRRLKEACRDALRFFAAQLAEDSFTSL
jgi:hypothetical protein